MDYNLIVTLDTPFSLDESDRIVGALSAYYPAAIERNLRLGVIITLPAASMTQAATSGLTVIERLTGNAVIAAEVMTTDEFDARDWVPPMPDLVSITEAAGELGITRQAVLKRAAGGGFRTARRVGTGWAIARREVTAAATLQRPGRSKSRSTE